MEVTLPRSRYLREWQQAAFFSRLLARVDQLPGVRSAGLVTQLPLSGPGFSGPFSIEGRPLDLSGPPPAVSYRAASAGYFAAMGVALRRGRLLATGDAPPAAPVALINETLARAFFGREEPLGRRLKLGAPGSPRPWLTVVGVIGDVSDGQPGARPGAQIYVPYAQEPVATMAVVVRAAAEPRGLASALRAALRAEDPEQAVSSLRTLEEVRAESVAPQSLSGAFLAGFALLALALTAVGVYGVVAHGAALRARELGIRVALGAGRGELLRLLVGQSLALALAGVALGAAGAFGSARLLASLLAGVAAGDPATLLGAAALLVAMAMLAAWLPAWRAASADPASVLRRD
ncbi:MAG TPA: FtsX-like permease family protein [Thermoanaerobaculia bacterium]|nr:FtsX-like permease family protein [Thermoanaerobaculia bacterium]